MPLEDSNIRSLSVRIPGDLTYCQVTGIKVLEDGRILICDSHNSKVKLFNFDGTYLSHYLVDGVPLDLCMIDEHTAAVTNDISSKITFLNIVGDKIMHDKDVDIKPGAVGICCISNNSTHMLLTYPWKNPPEVVQVDVDGKVLKTLRNNSRHTNLFMEHPVGICAFSGQIYVCCSSVGAKSDTIYQLSKEGEVLKTLHHSALKGVRYVNHDMFGNIYACSKLTSSIFRFERGGQSGRVMMSEKDGLRSPCAIGILDQTLYIAQDGQDEIQILTLDSFSDYFQSVSSYKALTFMV